MEKEKISSSLEDYLEAIYTNIKQDNKVKAITLSRQLQVSRASVTEALQRLAEKNYINYDRYGEISLTQKGEDAAKLIVSKHVLLCEFFQKVLHLDEKEASLNACKIEHIITEKAFNQFKLFMKEYK